MYSIPQVSCDFRYRYFIFSCISHHTTCIPFLVTGHTVYNMVLCSDDSSLTLQVHRGRDIGIQVVMVTIAHSTVSNTFRQRLATVSMHLMARLLDSTAEKSFGLQWMLPPYHFSQEPQGRFREMRVCYCVYMCVCLKISLSMPFVLLYISIHFLKNNSFLYQDALH